MRKSVKIYILLNINVFFNNVIWKYGIYDNHNIIRLIFLFNVLLLLLFPMKN